jgi:hypothetical protein
VSGTPGGNPKPVPVGVDEGALPPGEPFLVDADVELLGHGVDVPDVEVDQGVRPGVARVLGEVEPDIPARDRDEPGKARLELMLPLLTKPRRPYQATARAASSTRRTGTTSSSTMPRVDESPKRRVVPGSPAPRSVRCDTIRGMEASRIGPLGSPYVATCR